MTNIEQLEEDILTVLYENEGDLEAQARATIKFLIDEGLVVPDDNEGPEDDFEDEIDSDEW